MGVRRQFFPFGSSPLGFLCVTLKRLSVKYFEPKRGDFCTGSPLPPRSAKNRPAHSGVLPLPIPRFAPDSDENLFSSLSETEGSVKIFERNSLKESGAGAEMQKASFAGTFSKKQ